MAHRYRIIACRWQYRKRSTGAYGATNEKMLRGLPNIHKYWGNWPQHTVFNEVLATWLQVLVWVPRWHES